MKQFVGNLIFLLIITALSQSDDNGNGTAVDPYVQDPIRSPLLVVHSAKPFNAETPPGLLTWSFYTPNDIFYVRNNYPVPRIDINAYTLTVEGRSLRPTTFTFLQLMSMFPAQHITAVLQCAGNRRSEMDNFRPVSGTKWMGGAIGNAEWTGIGLRQILAFVGFDWNNYAEPYKMHIHFEALDKDPNSGKYYGASIPISYLLDYSFHPILAYGMNGQPLPPDHGFPLRVILPGIVGVRNVKWLKAIRIADYESESNFQKRKYKAFSSNVRKGNVTEQDYLNTPPIMQLPVTSYITSHRSGDNVADGDIVLKGYSFSGHGRSIVRVELSSDQGNSWINAKITQRLNPTDNWSPNWSWIFWESPPFHFESNTTQEIWAKGVDSEYNHQPIEVGDIWNFEGYLMNAYDKIILNILP